MNKFLNVIGWLMVALYAVVTVSFWNEIFPGGIGFFGAILTLPMAMFLAFLSGLTSLSSAVSNIVWVLVAYWLISRGQE